MIVEIGSHRLFYGFYESIYYNSDMFYDDEFETKEELEEIVGNDKISVCYEIKDYKEYEKDVCRVFMIKLVEKIKECLPCDILENKDFKFDIVDDKNNIIVSSPKEYNFTTDKCYCNVETNVETLEMIKEYTLSLKGASQYIIDHHSSYDGFISFIKNDIDYWKELSIEEYVYEERYLIALLDMLILMSYENDVRFELNEETYEEIDLYEYDIIKNVYYENKEYELNEFYKKIENMEL